MRHAKLTARRLIVVLVAMPSSLAITASPVLAGSNGQEIAYLVRCYANYTQTDGYNQNGQFEERWLYTPAADPGNGCSQPAYLDWHWWWVGTVTVQGWWNWDGNNASQSAGSSNYYIPRSQDGDWTYVQTPS